MPTMLPGIPILASIAFTASTASPSSFRITHRATTVGVDDINTGFALAAEPLSDVGTVTVQARDAIVVNSLVDGADSLPGDGSCATAGGACTLRAAIMEANALAGPDRIDLAAGAHVLTAVGSEDAGLAGDIDTVG